MQVCVPSGDSIQSPSLQTPGGGSLGVLVTEMYHGSLGGRWGLSHFQLLRQRPTCQGMSLAG